VNATVLLAFKKPQKVFPNLIALEVTHRDKVYQRTRQAPFRLGTEDSAMRNVSVQEFEEHPGDFFAEVEAGTRLTIVRDNKPVVTMEPVTAAVKRPIYEETPREQEARKRLLALMDEGIDLGGKAPSREEMHERF
jgi:antitoxin (DNA-binding transcriptional repressor) of toxin-antitoxin stability system